MTMYYEVKGGPCKFWLNEERGRGGVCDWKNGEFAYNVINEYSLYVKYLIYNNMG